MSLLIFDRSACYVESSAFVRPIENAIKIRFGEVKAEIYRMRLPSVSPMLENFFRELVKFALGLAIVVKLKAN